jgi:amidase
MKHERDKNKSNQDHPIYGIPILVKTIQTWRECLPRREHILLRNNSAADAFIITNKNKGLLFWGKQT